MEALKESLKRQALAAERRLGGRAGGSLPLLTQSKLEDVF